MSTLNCQTCRKLDAAAADLRIRLQKVHGALHMLRHPEDGGSTPREAWRFNPNAIRDLNANYNLPTLLEETRPDASSGVAILDELRRAKEALEIALAALDWYANEKNYAESVEPACAGEVILKDTVEEVWIPDTGFRAQEAVTKITGKKFHQ